MFQLFRRNKGRDALTAVAYATDGVGIASIERDTTGMPHLVACDFRASGDGGAVATLGAALDDHALGRTRCTTLMNAGDYQLLLVEAPDVEPSELRAALRWRLKDLIDFHIDDAVVDVFEIPGQDRGRARMMYAVAARASRVRQRIDEIESTGLDLQTIDIEEMALRNLAALAEEDGRGLCLLAFGADDGHILAVRGGELYLARRIEIGANQLFSAAQHGDPDIGDFGEPLTAALDQLTLEVQRSVDYYDSHFSLPPLQTLLVAPSVPETPFVARYLDANLNLRAADLDLARLFPGATLPEPATVARCLTAVGAALRVDEVVL